MDSSGHRSVPIFVLFLLVLLGLFLIATPAFADGMGVVYGPVSYGNAFDEHSDVAVAVYAENKYDAALYACGYDPNGSAITSDVKAYLSNASTGGAFYSFAQKFENHNNPSDFSNLAGGAGDTGITRGVVSILNEQYGASNVWIANYQSQERTGAITSIGLVIAGNVGGGAGGGSGGSSDPLQNGYYIFSGSPRVGNWTGGNSAYNWYDMGGTTKYAYNKYLLNQGGYDVGLRPITIKVPASLLAAVESTYPHDSYNWIILADPYNGGIRNFYLYIYSTYTESNGVSGYEQYSGISTISLSANKRYYYSFTTNEKTNQVRSGSTITCAVEDDTKRATVQNWNASSVSSDFYIALPLGVTEITPIVPPTNWPDDPTPEPPTQPVVPDPPTGGTPPQLTNPTTYPSDTTVINNTYTVDIQGILDAMADHCQHIRDSIYKNCKMVYEGITDYMQDLAEWWSGVIDDEFDNLCDYLQDLFDWLADQFDFSVSGTGYDDNTVVSWLRRIYYKLGTGTNTKPSDPVANPFDIGQWLATLFGNLFTALDDLAGGLLSSIADWVSALSSKFPFSIPFDIAFILGLLVADPVAPNFDVPMYTLNAGGGLVEVGMIEVDLADWSQYLEGVRFMIKVCFVMFLAMHTKDFMELMEKAVGLGA